MCLSVALNYLIILRLPSSPRIVIVKNRALSTVGLFTLFLLGFDRTTFDLSIHVCKGVAAVIQFFGLALFSWTALEGYQLLRTLRSNHLTDANSSKYSNLIRYLIGYGTPLIFTFMALFISFVDNNDGNDLLNTMGYCWLREQSFIFFFIAPAAAVVVFNCFVFVKAFMATYEVRKKRGETSLVEKIYGQMKSSFLISFMLGLTWASGFLIQDNLEGFSYLFVILNGSFGIVLFIHTILMNDIVMLEIKIRLGLVDHVELAINNSGNRITASKSFSAIDREKPKIQRRHKHRQHNESTSSDELPPAPRPQRKQVLKRKQERVVRSAEVYTVGQDQSPASTPENTSLSSSASVTPSSFEQSSSESLYRRREQKLESRVWTRTARPPPEAGPGGQVNHAQHGRVAELLRENKLKRHHSNKW